MFKIFMIFFNILNIILPMVLKWIENNLNWNRIICIKIQVLYIRIILISNKMGKKILILSNY